MIGNQFLEVPIRKRAYIIIFIAVAAIGFVLRLYQFGAVPDGIHYDEAMLAVDAKAIAEHGTDHYGRSRVRFRNI